ncbi:hypothetical protein [Winogradskyella sediminis]|uniref:hypothetical protein n=1 Tax=Winogradskyella sediminis TaxID=1382466 RepID=UPI000E233487|nr:hypothetical protein [Winogradskyella sediminis]REG83352.1 hypothetical protein C8N41_1143 [Winogradskyella sediminis]
MSEKGILHIKLFKYLIKKDGAFGYVQIRDFLIEHFEDIETEKSRLRIKHFLDFLISENYIEKKPYEQRGIWIISEPTGFVKAKDISSVIRIKPKGVEIYQSYRNDRFKKNISRIGVFFSAVAFVLSILTLKKPSTEQYDKLNKKMDSIIKVMNQKPKLEKSDSLEKK